MHGHVGLAGEHCGLYFFDENSGAADGVEGFVGALVAGGFDDHQLRPSVA
jgi:hypothetical protein